MTASVTTFVLPGGVDDVSRPSGGNLYDRRMSEILSSWVNEVSVPGSWPLPDRAARAELAMTLAALPDGSVVLVDGLVACGVPEVIVPAAKRLRLAVLLHLPLGDETGLPATLATDLDARERETLQAVTAVVATSPWAARRLISHHGLDPNRVHVAPPGTDPAPLAHGTDGYSRLLCVASVTPRKGQDVLVEALAGVADLPWYCECIGAVSSHPGYVERLLRLISLRGLSGRITLAGPLPPTDLAPRYSAADLVVLPSRAETYGMAVTEALARGVPVLASAAGALPDTLGKGPDGGVPGILVPPGDAAALSNALRRFLTEARLRDRLRSSARDRRRLLEDWDMAARRLAGVLTRLWREPSCAV
ncbi:MAG TPA: glycosyltransferase family 4 protein [Actinophytocola sp.]|uniref:glycosyltransferase family 4 protein n=1 Tax=Actinophytocola sp. TaxID=1872138 RepID=UPI002DB823AE|nr:glycosyltransferase family 4 protein [Actinophytocola sp.]HEU5475541.1 glycosyltransferase family 4 protein [Actinophytocola sp.]